MIDQCIRQLRNCGILVYDGAVTDSRQAGGACRPKGRKRKMTEMKEAKFQIGQVVKHRLFPFRGVIFDVDPVFNNTEEWYQSIPAEVRPQKDQHLYHLLAETAARIYIALVYEQNLVVEHIS